jgi:hypothetical protein
LVTTEPAATTGFSPIIYATDAGRTGCDPHVFLNHDALPDCGGAWLRRLKGMARGDHKSSWTMKRASAAKAVPFVQSFS